MSVEDLIECYVKAVITSVIIMAIIFAVCALLHFTGLVEMAAFR